MDKVVPNSKVVGHSTEIIQQSKIKGPLYPNKTTAIVKLNYILLESRYKLLQKMKKAWKQKENLVI